MAALPLSREKTSTWSVGELASILDTVPGTVTLWDRSLRNCYANASVATWTGRTPHQMFGTTLGDSTDSEVIRANREYVDGVLAGVPQVFERDVRRRADGTPARVHIVYVPNIVDGQIDGFLALTTDISHRTGTEGSVHSYTEQAAISDLRQGVAADVDRLVVSGLDDAVETLRHALHSPDQAPALMETAAATVDDTIIELRRAVKELQRATPASATDWNLSAGRLGLRTAAISRIVPPGSFDHALTDAMASPGVVTSRTSRRLREWVVEDVVAILDHIPAAICALNLDVRLTFANRTALTAFGRTDRAEVIGRPAKEVLGEDIYAGNRPFVRAALHGHPARIEHSFIERSGTRRYAQGVYVPDTVGGRLVGMVAVILELSTLPTAPTSLPDVVEAAVLRDRHRIAENLHDLVIQRLFAAGLAIQSAQRTSGRARDEWLRTTGVSLDEAITELRSSIHNLTGPDELVDLPFDVARVVRQETIALGFPPALTYIGSARHVPADLGVQLLAVLTEALSNAARHAAATRVDITISVQDDLISLSVADDGRGMDDIDQPSGLANMAMRAHRLDGSFRWRPNLPRGTVIEWQVPR